MTKESFSSLYEESTNSLVHQIILSNGPVDRIPSHKIDKLKSEFIGDHTLWNEDMIIDLIKSNFDSNILDAFTSVKPLAFKADLARYCILYVYGGWYFDLFVDLENHEALKNFEKDIEAILFREIPVPPFGSVYSVVNTLFWFKNASHPILANLINSVASNINTKNYGQHPFDVTGPMVFGREIAKYQFDTPSNFLIGDCQMMGSRPSHVFNTIDFDDPIVFSRRRSLNEDISKYVPTGYEKHPNNYYKMWFDRTIFN